jgi:hypothetical protein
MKKLLALILCVMMFVSVISTSAFAAYDTTDQRVWKGESQNKKIVEALRTNIENMYGSYAVDNAVFSSVKSIDKIIKDLVDGMLNDYGTTPWAGAAGLTSAGTLNDAIVDGLRRTIGGQITDYISKHQNDYYRYDSMGNKIFNPSAYAGVYAKAASEALTSGKAVAGIQAYMMYCAQRSAFNSIANQAHDLQVSIDAWDHWGDYGFGDDVDSVNNPGAILTWHVPGTDIDGLNDLDGLLHNIDASYATVLSTLGQLGVNLDNSSFLGEDTFGLGFDGWVRTVDGDLALSQASDNETVNTPLLTSITNRDVDENGFNDKITVYEGIGKAPTANLQLADDNGVLQPVGVDGYDPDLITGIRY